MNCTRANQLIEPFLDDRLNIRDTWQYLRHIDECPSCRAELDLENVFRCAADASVTDTEGYDLSHRLDDLIAYRYKRIRTCMLTYVMDLFLILLIISVIMIRVI